MPNLKEVKQRINSVISTQQITKAMKMVSAAKLRKAQDKIIQIRPYSQKLQSILRDVLENTSNGEQSIYTSQKTISSVLVVLITSDRGLCGPFNSNVIKQAVVSLENDYSDKQTNLMCIGRKGIDFFKRRKYELIDTYTDLFKSISFDKVSEVSQWIINNFSKRKYDKIEIIYNKFINIATKVVVKEQFLPFFQERDLKKKKIVEEYIFEPSKKEIILELIPNFLKITFYKALLESNASEHGARMTAMDKATENANELLRDLKLTFNRTRQSVITKEILEIVGGAEALSQS